MRLVSSTALALCAALSASTALAQPFAGDPNEDENKEEKPRPERRNWTVKNGGFAFAFEFTPGIAMPEKVSEIIIIASAIPETPHPQYGNRIPLKDARIVVEAINPAGESIGRYLAHQFPLSAGRYGLHITPTTEGVYTLKVSGRTAGGKALSAELKMPVDVWPLPEELQGSGDDKGSGRTGPRRPIIIKK